MPTLTHFELDILRKLSNKIFDILYQDLNLNEKRADEITHKVIDLIEREAKS